MKYWSRSALSIYKYLLSMSNSIDKSINDTGKNSNSVSLQKYQTTFFQTNKILELIDRKRKIINIKVAVENASQDLKEAADLTGHAMLKLRKDQDITTETIGKICKALNCQMTDIMEFVEK